MNIITLDFETYYDKEYTLSKMTTEEYIRDERFEIIGVSVKVNGGVAEWFSGEFSTLQKYLQANYNWRESAVLAHNTVFDGAILSWVLDIHPKVLFDTLCMARAIHGITVGGSLGKLVKRYGLGEKGTEIINALGKRRLDFTPEELSRYGDYCVNDTELTYKLFNEMVKQFPMSELKVIDATLRMFTEPFFSVDTTRIERHLENIKKNKEELLRAVGLDKKELMSNNKFAEALRNLGIEPPMKISPRTGKDTFAFAKTDQAMRDLADHDDYRVSTLVAARTGLKSTLEETRAQRFLDIGKRGKLPVPIKYYAAHTGRWGGFDKINMQNLPSRGTNAKVLKSCIVPPPGYVVIDADLSQIEARVLAWLAQQNDLVTGFAEAQDVYTHMASVIYNKAEEDITPEERFVGKTTILGAGYGMGAKRFREQLATSGVVVSLDEARRIIDIYRGTNYNIQQFWYQCGEVLRALYNGESGSFGVNGLLKYVGKDTGLRMPSGLMLYYNNLHIEKDEEGRDQFMYDTRYGPNKIYGGKVTENVCQAVARCVIAEQIVKINKRIPVRMTVHDSVICCVPEGAVEESAKYIASCMRWAPDWAAGLPVDCELEVGPTYGEVSKTKY